MDLFLLPVFQPPQKAAHPNSLQLNPTRLVSAYDVKCGSGRWLQHCQPGPTHIAARIMLKIIANKQLPAVKAEPAPTNNISSWWMLTARHNFRTQLRPTGSRPTKMSEAIADRRHRLGCQVATVQKMLALIKRHKVANIEWLNLGAVGGNGWAMKAEIAGGTKFSISD